MNPQPLIGISGRKRAGKDTLASFLVKDHGFTRLAFADPLKAIITELNPILAGEEQRTDWGDGPLRVQDAITEHGAEAAKDLYPEYRRLLQGLGESVRRHIGPDVWLDATISKAHYLLAEGKPVVLPGVRYPNEADRIKALGGIVVRVNRPGTADGTSSTDLHISETALDEYAFDVTVENTGAPEDLAWVVEYLREHTRRPNWRAATIFSGSGNSIIS